MGFKQWGLIENLVGDTPASKTLPLSLQTIFCGLAVQYNNDSTDFGYDTSVQIGQLTTSNIILVANWFGSGARKQTNAYYTVIGQ